MSWTAQAPKAPQQEVIWEPQVGPQTALIACPVFEVFFGGARGGGKTESSIGDWLSHAGQYGTWATGVFFRRKFKQLEQVIRRTQEIFPRLGAKYNEQKAEWRMPGGAFLTFRYIERDSDAQEYQGHSYTRVYVEEATNFPSASPLNLLRATVRSAKGVPVGFRLTGNPGGPGHNHVKARYITPNPAGWEILVDEVEGLSGEMLKVERVFIPSKIADNALLWKNDPMYVARLRQAGSQALVNAWLKGDWDLVDGAFFDCWDPDLHVLSSKDWLPRIPPYALRFRSFDWGFARPFCVGWYAVSDGTWGLPDGALLKYREWYGNDGRPNEGLRMVAPDVARGILNRESGELIAYGVADPSIYVRDGGPSIAEGMAIAGVTWKRADNKRLPGWSEVRARLIGREGLPTLYILDCCGDTIRTLPIVQHDEKDAEDLDTESEDHAVDETRYAVMSRPWTEREPRAIPGLIYPKTVAQLTLNELFSRHQARLRIEEQEAA